MNPRLLLIRADKAIGRAENYLDAGEIRQAFAEMAEARRLVVSAQELM
jgi:hypothetical protein